MYTQRTLHEKDIQREPKKVRARFTICVIEQAAKDRMRALRFFFCIGSCRSSLTVCVHHSSCRSPAQRIPQKILNACSASVENRSCEGKKSIGSTKLTPGLPHFFLEKDNTSRVLVDTTVYTYRTGTLNSSLCLSEVI